MLQAMLRPSSEGERSAIMPVLSSRCPTNEGIKGGKTTVHLCTPTLPSRGLPRLSRAHASPRPVRWVQGVGGTASEGSATLYLDAHGPGLGSGLETFPAAPRDATR